MESLIIYSGLIDSCRPAPHYTTDQSPIYTERWPFLPATMYFTSSYIRWTSNFNDATCSPIIWLWHPTLTPLLLTTISASLRYPPPPFSFSLSLSPNHFTVRCTASSSPHRGSYPNTLLALPVSKYLVMQLYLTIPRVMLGVFLPHVPAQYSHSSMPATKRPRGSLMVVMERGAERETGSPAAAQTARAKSQK